MFEIHRDTLYSKDDLAEGLKGICDVDRLLDRVRVKAVIMGVYLGADLVKAIQSAPDYRELVTGQSRGDKSRRRPRKRADKQSPGTRPVPRIEKIDIAP